MKRKINACVLLLISVLSVISSNAQDQNLSFEEDLKNWYPIGQHEKYIIKTDSTIKFDGAKSLYIQNAEPSQGFGGLMHKIPRNIIGDSIELSVKVKLKDVTKGSKLGFMLRIDPEVYFNNFQHANVTGTAEWKEYKIKAKLNTGKTSAIFLGLFLSGEGSVWADQVQIKVDDKGLNNNLYTDYKDDFSNITQSGVSEFMETPNINTRLSELGKIWGLLKYRHPELAKGDYEWDAELFNGINQIVAAKTNLDIEKYYTQLLDSLGNNEIGSPPSTDQQIIQQIDYSWIDHLPFDQKLKNKLLNLRYTSFDKNYYYSFNPGVQNVKIEHEYSYPQLLDPDVGFRLLSLFRFWNIVQYFSPYRELTDTPWNEILLTYIPKMIKADNQLKYERTVASMLSEIKDAHTKLWGNPKKLNIAMGLRTLPVEFKFVEGKAMVIKVMDNDTSLIKRGDILIEKNGKKIDEIRDSVYQFIASPNPAVVEREMAVIIRRSKTEFDNLEIDRKGKELNLKVPTIMMKDLVLEKDTVAIRYLKGGIIYLNHANLSTTVLKENEEKLKKSKGIVIDCRNYPKEFLVFVLTPYLLPEATGFVKFSKTDYNNLGAFTYTPVLNIGQTNPDYYKGKIAILIDQQTQSSAEYHTMAYRTAPKAKVFGSQTAGADGNISQFVLPGHLSTSISGIGVYYPDGTETQRIGIIPDVEVKPTIKGIWAEKDEVMEKALKYLNGQ